MPARKPYFCNCVAWHRPDLALLEELIEEGEDITYRDFAARVDSAELREMERNLGYGRGGLTMEGDYHVRYKLHRETGIPFAIHSAVEHVFATILDIDRLREIVGDKLLLDEEVSLEMEEDERELLEIDFQMGRSQTADPATRPSCHRLASPFPDQRLPVRQDAE